MDHHQQYQKDMDVDCHTQLENGEKCQGVHCIHCTEPGVCNAGDDPDWFYERYCGECRYRLYLKLNEHTQKTRRDLVARVKQGETLFLFTGYMHGNQHEYEHLNSGKKFHSAEEPTTHDAVQAIGRKWLEKQPQETSKNQTTMEQYLR